MVKKKKQIEKQMAKKKVAKKQAAKKQKTTQVAKEANKTIAKKIALQKTKSKKRILKKVTKETTGGATRAPAAKAQKDSKKMKTSKVQKDVMLGHTIAPFSVLNSQGHVVTQDDFKGGKTVLYFYPKDDTPGCTLEGQQFSALKTAFDSANTKVFGVSKDSSQSHDKFICKFGFKIDLLSDENEKLCTIFDVIKEKNMYGRKYMGIERSTFVLDENLKVIKEMRKVSPDGHAQEILDFVKSL